MPEIVNSNEGAITDASALPRRILSIDVLRGLTILVMIFVNDLAGVRPGVPAWMEHIQPPDADGMTFVDVVFPAFLFIVGMSIPFAIGRRLEAGDALGKVWGHILARTLSLLTIGFFMVNSETISKTGPLSPHVWELLMYSGVGLMWVSMPGEWWNRRSTVLGMRAAGAVVLIAAAVLYRGNDGTGLIQMRPQWWGILGLIGWAYLAACAAYMLLPRRMAWVFFAICLLYGLKVADSAGLLSWLGWLTRWVPLGDGLGSQAAVTVSGMAVGMMLAPDSPVKEDQARIRWAILFGLMLLAAGHLLHALHDSYKMFIFNKINATPPWCLVSSGITTLIWVAAYYLIDVRNSADRVKLLSLAGQNALLAYLLAPVIGNMIAVLGLSFYNQLGDGFAVGFWRSLALAFAITLLAAFLRTRNVLLRV